jgi:hypothetical protein
MNEIETKIEKLLADRERLAQLLSLEKKRRGVPQDSLVFVATANVAKHWWCTQQAVFTSRTDELSFFSVYLYDRIVCAHRLGLMHRLPRRREALLEIGAEITLADVEKLFKKDTEQPRRADVTFIYEDTVDDQGRRTRLINPDLSPEEKSFAADMTEEEGDVRVIDILEADPMRRGALLHLTRAERYPTFRWHFTWDRYTIIGVPDGLTDQFVYEYKTTRNRVLFRFMKSPAFAQADLYGYFFQRPSKRVQIYVLEENRTETFEALVDVTKAEDTLAAFARVDAGEAARPPRAWKCRICAFRGTCPICQAE